MHAHVRGALHDVVRRQPTTGRPPCRHSLRLRRGRRPRRGAERRARRTGSSRPTRCGRPPRCSNGRRAPWSGTAARGVTRYRACTSGGPDRGLWSRAPIVVPALVGPFPTRPWRRTRSWSTAPAPVADAGPATHWVPGRMARAGGGGPDRACEGVAEAVGTWRQAPPPRAVASPTTCWPSGPPRRPARPATTVPPSVRPTARWPQRTGISVRPDRCGSGGAIGLDLRRERLACPAMRGLGSQPWSPPTRRPSATAPCCPPTRCWMVVAARWRAGGVGR